MTSKNAIALALSSLFVAASANAVTIYEADNGDFVKLYGEVGVGGHIGANYEYGEFYADQNYVDDSFATMGVKGKNDKMHYRLELDYERENWAYGTGDMVLAIDKVFIGYDLYKSDVYSHYVEVGLTDTAFDDYDKWGDFTFDTTVETGEAGDQDMTVKYEGKYFSGIEVGVSYTNRAESSSGSELGDIVNGYVGYFGDRLSAVVGLEGRAGSDGASKYGEQQLLGFGARLAVTDDIHLGVNAYIEEEDIAQDRTLVSTDPITGEKTYINSNYQTLENKGYLASAKYKFSKTWEFTASYNFEEYEQWSIDNASSDVSDHKSWGDDRTWGTIGVNYKPTTSSIIALEMNTGDAAQDAYAYARVYF
ncbi:porin [Vibrio sp. 99-70-13A1]|uniref:porin n=1 Tax=Vibrio sp. 99-70-13A1 TaxID=2607601 RepID=UPI0014936C07|nr:porin [Vibrio sp. 99-70-13A1]NOH96551.1 porin [Vibrio sp. 99-70-13A1]